MEQNKWEVKSHSHQIADTGDYDGHWEITNGEISICTKDDGDDMDVILKEVADLLNKTEITFYADNPKEIDLHFECEGLKIQFSELQAKCDRYESLLKRMQHLQPIWLYQGHIKPEHEGEALALANLSSEINEALSAGEGEKEVKPEAGANGWISVEDQLPT